MWRRLGSPVSRVPSLKFDWKDGSHSSWGATDREDVECHRVPEVTLSAVGRARGGWRGSPDICRHRGLGITPVSSKVPTEVAAAVVPGVWASGIPRKWTRAEPVRITPKPESLLGITPVSSKVPTEVAAAVVPVVWASGIPGEGKRAEAVGITPDVGSLLVRPSQYPLKSECQTGLVAVTAKLAPPGLLVECECKNPPRKPMAKMID
ncbi:uncharacterized protein LOC113959484 [Corapipo altera]|uniref:uncharacterized protein LOC113959484 n=1 Tax=Corapipo altera TaxID=415028 RepID=UPI000FD6352E|nr:uncharacterized protein LOC113959484 [Corapipo altera]